MVTTLMHDDATTLLVISPDFCIIQAYRLLVCVLV